MIFSIELERLPDGRVKASTSTADDGLWAIRPTVRDAILAVSPEETDLEHVAGTLNLREDVFTPAVADLSNPRVATGGDNDNMRYLLRRAAIDGRRVLIEYTDSKDNKTTREVLPDRLDWGANGRTLKAVDNGTPKTFYLHRIARAEVRDDR